MDLKEYIRTHPHRGVKPLYIGSGDKLMLFWEDADVDDSGYAVPIMRDGVHVGSLIHSGKTKEIVGVKMFGGIFGLVLPEQKSEPLKHPIDESKVILWEI